MGSFKDCKTFFQTNKMYTPSLAIPTDGVVVHPHNIVPHNNIEMHDSWNDKAKAIGRMFFSDSDDLNEYTTGNWDGQKHSSEIELKEDGEPMMCAGIRPYMVANDNWIAYLRDTKVLPSLENGIDAILPEEPLGHTFTGYEEMFKSLYEDFYGIKWEGQETSPIAFYRTAYLKGLLYNKLETELMSFTKEYSKNKSREVDFIVPIHSIFSNMANGLVAPLGLSLNTKDYDGYIGQIWTGPIKWCLANYESPDKSFFSSAFTLYDYFVQLVVGSEKKLWLLIDPVEDDPNHSWDQFRSWYQDCATAMLFMKDVDSYEVMPWPERTFLSTSFTPGLVDYAQEKTPKDYITLILSITQALQDIPLGGQWIGECKESQIGIAVADSVMWQKNDGPRMQGVYALRMPLHQKGIIASNCIMERITEKDYADRFKVIVVSFEDWKPYKEEMIDGLIEWVHEGGTLLILGKDSDSLDSESCFWWQEKGYKSALEALLQKLNYNQNSNHWGVGNGFITYDPISPKEFSNPETAQQKYINLLSQASESAGVNFAQETGYFAMKRGEYLIVHSISKPFSAKGNFVDIFSNDLKVMDGITVEKNKSMILKDVSEIIAKNPQPCVLGTTFRLIYEDFSRGKLRFVVKGPKDTNLTARIYKGSLKVANISAKFNNKSESLSWVDDNHKTFRIICPNHPDGTEITIIFE